MNSYGASRWQALSAAMPGVRVALFVAAKCPACWLAYAGLLTMPGRPGPVRQPLSVPVRCALRMTPGNHEKAHHGKDRTMATKRTIEIFSAGCAACEETVTLVNRIACPSCDVTVLDMHHPEVARRAKQLGIRTVPAVVINGTLAACCTGSGPDEATLRAAGVGQTI